jgi:rhamnogalacturonyl hydrolase YesR
MNRRAFLKVMQTAAASEAVTKLALGQSAQDSKERHSPVGNWQSEIARRTEKSVAAAMAMQRRDWEQGILAQALLEAGDRDRVILLTKAAIVQRTPDGRLGVLQSGSPTDPAMGGAAYAEAAEWTGDPQIRQAVDGLLNWIRFRAPRNHEGVLYHVFGAPEMWSDGFNCAPPFLAAMGFYDEAFAQIEGFWRRLWNPERKLLAHIWDDGNRQFRDPNFWGGGNGWAVVGLARVIGSLPPDRRRARERVAAIVQEILNGCLNHQRVDGLFYNVVDQPATFVETNLAQMLAYAIYKGVAGGWLPKTYLAQGHRMRDAARGKMDAFGYVQGVCGAPGFDHPGTSTEGQAICVLMEAAAWKAENMSL